MLRLSVAILALGLLFAACGGGAAAGTTPEGTFKAAQSAVKGKDWGAFFDLLATSAQDQMKQPFEMAKNAPDEAKAQICEQFGIDPDELDGMDLRGFFVAMMGKMAEENKEDIDNMMKAEVIDTKIEGDEAVVKFKSGDEEEEMEMIKVDGKWLIADFD